MIEVEHLSKTYGATPAIADITFSVEKGEILGFLGPNGAGKTTTMRILTGYLPATSGTARVAGFDVHENSLAVRQRIGYLPETPPLYTEMTVEGFLYFVSRIKGVVAGDRATRVQTALTRCNLLEKRHTLIRKLSKGFRQRVGLAQAIVHDPPVIILDEPTVGLDPRQIIDVRNLIKSLAGDHTIILSTHILPEVSMTCSRVAIINRGRVVATNTPDRLVEELTGGNGYELEVEGDFAAVQERLQALAGVKSVEAILNETAKPNAADPLPEHHFKIRLVSQPGADPGRAIASTVVGAGLGLFEMRRTTVTLEDVFLELTMEDVTATADAQDADTPDTSTPDTSTPDPATSDPATSDSDTPDEKQIPEPASGGEAA